MARARPIPMAAACSRTAAAISSARRQRAALTGTARSSSRAQAAAPYHARLVRRHERGESRTGLVEDGSGNLFGTTTPAAHPGRHGLRDCRTAAAPHHARLVQRHKRWINPQAGLVEDSSGDLFGTTASGGPYGDGTVFEAIARTNSRPGIRLTTLASFNGTNGADPTGSLVEDSSGNLFGTTLRAAHPGTARSSRSCNGSGIITTLASFNGTNGANP